jgi:hypothetical protein
MPAAAGAGEVTAVALGEGLGVSAEAVADGTAAPTGLDDGDRGDVGAVPVGPP